MSDSDNDFSESMRPGRMQKHISTRSEVSVQDDEDITNAPDSINLLDEAGRDLDNQVEMDSGSLTEKMIAKAVKRAIEPMSCNVKQMKVQLAAQERKMTAIYQQNEAQAKQLKELKAESSKGPEDLSVLLTADGLIFLKKMCLKNLDCKAKEDIETEMFQGFFKKANDEGWLLKRSDKAEKDIISRFRDKRNYLKAQIRQRIHEDIVNKTPTLAIKLEKTLKFLRDHLGVAELGDDFQHIIYTYAYIQVKYCNKNTNVDTMSDTDKEVKKRVVEGVWEEVMFRVEDDGVQKRSFSSVKRKFQRLLETGIEFKP